MFAGLFVVVAGFEEALLTPGIVTEIGQMGLADMGVLSAVTAVLSNLVSNVPAVLVLRPFVGQSGDAQHAWLVVAMASTLAGNLTVLGSVANLIVVQLARAEGVTIGFWEYFRVGAPLTLLTILLGLWWLSAGAP
jgi:Na+/H+ antiporter NhaD/arsenite permease-like protein